VTTEEVRAELLWIAWDHGITLSQALGVALQEWLLTRRRGVSHPGCLSENEENAGRHLGDLHPLSDPRKGRFRAQGLSGANIDQITGTPDGSLGRFAKIEPAESEWG